MTLENGLQLVVVPRPGVPKATVVLAHPGGKLTGRAGLSDLLSPLLLPAFGFASCEFRAGSVPTPFDTSELFIGESVDVACLLAHAAAKAQTTIDTERFEAVRTKVAAEMTAGNELSPSTRLLFRDASAFLSSAPAQVEAISLAELEGYRDATREPSHSGLVVVGDVDPDATLREAQAAFKEWVRKDIPRPAPTATLSLDARPPRAVVIDEDSALVSLSLSCLTRPGPQPNHAADLVATLVHQRFSQVRTQFGASYGDFTQGEPSPLAERVKQTLKIPSEVFGGDTQWNDGRFCPPPPALNRVASIGVVEWHDVCGVTYRS